MTRHEALNKIDSIRAALPVQEQEDDALVNLIRDLWDGDPISECGEDATYLRRYGRINAAAAALIDEIVHDITEGS